MPFAPGIDDKTADYIYNSYDTNARLGQQQQQFNAQQNQQNLATALDAVNSFTQTAKKNQAVAGGIAALAQVAPQYGINEEDLQGLLAEKNPDKAAGQLLIYQDLLQNKMHEQQQQRAMEANLNYQRQKAALWSQAQGASQQTNPYIPSPTIGEGIDFSQ